MIFYFFRINAIIDACLITIMLLALPGTTVLADQSEYTAHEIEIKVALLYTLSKFVQWPEAENTTQRFICVLGEDPFDDVLNEIDGKRSRGKTVTIQRYKIKQPQIEACHILFISQSESNRSKALIKSLSNKPILTISDIDQFTHQGGVMKFTDDGNNIGFEINLTRARRNQLNISAPLLELSNIIEE